MSLPDWWSFQTECILKLERTEEKLFLTNVWKGRDEKGWKTVKTWLQIKKKALQGHGKACPEWRRHKAEEDVLKNTCHVVVMEFMKRNIQRNFSNLMHGALSRWSKFSLISDKGDSLLIFRIIRKLNWSCIQILMFRFGAVNFQDLRRYRKRDKLKFV